MGLLRTRSSQLLPHPSYKIHHLAFGPGAIVSIGRGEKGTVSAVFGLDQRARVMVKIENGAWKYQP